jgi:DNA-binding NarL/FixJ family response regulator
MKKIRLLLADDHAIIRDGIRLTLRKSSEIEIISEANSGTQVIDYLERNPNNIDVVLMDIDMPIMDGIEATQIITEKFTTVKVLAFTMQAEEMFMTNMIKAGALGYILKDSDIEEITHAIKVVSKGEKYYSNEVSVAMINSLMNQDNSKGTALSEREEEVLTCVANGNSNKEAGEKLFISPRTIETHRRNIQDKLDLRNTAEMIKYAFQNNLVK